MRRPAFKVLLKFSLFKVLVKKVRLLEKLAVLLRRKLNKYLKSIYFFLFLVKRLTKNKKFFQEAKRFNFKKQIFLYIFFNDAVLDRCWTHALIALFLLLRK